MITRFLAIAISLAALSFLAACSKSSTTEASSESSSNSSTSSSGGSEKSDTAYQRDVRDYTAAFAASDGNVDSFQRDLSEIANGYGVSDWERTDATFVAIGRGLAMAKVDDRRYHELAVQLSNKDHHRLTLVRSGYETARLQ